MKKYATIHVNFGNFTRPNWEFVNNSLPFDESDSSFNLLVTSNYYTGYANLYDGTSQFGTLKYSLGGANATVADPYVHYFPTSGTDQQFFTGGDTPERKLFGNIVVTAMKTLEGERNYAIYVNVLKIQ